MVSKARSRVRGGGARLSVRFPRPVLNGIPTSTTWTPTPKKSQSVQDVLGTGVIATSHVGLREKLSSYGLIAAELNAFAMVKQPMESPIV